MSDYTMMILLQQICDLKNDYYILLYVINQRNPEMSFNRLVRVKPGLVMKLLVNEEIKAIDVYREDFKQNMVMTRLSCSKRCRKKVKKKTHQSVGTVHMIVTGARLGVIVTTPRTPSPQS